MLTRICGSAEVFAEDLTSAAAGMTKVVLAMIADSIIFFMNSPLMVAINAATEIRCHHYDACGHTIG